MRSRTTATRGRSGDIDARVLGAHPGLRGAPGGRRQGARSVGSLVSSVRLGGTRRRMDAELDRRKREAYETTLVRVAASRRARQAAIALKMQEKALDSIEVLAPGMIEPKDLPRFIETAAKMEREGRSGCRPRRRRRS